MPLLQSLKKRKTSLQVRKSIPESLSCVTKCCINPRVALRALFKESDEEEEDFEEMMECDDLPPLKMKVIAEGLDLRSINDKTKNKGEGSIVTFQIAATHDMGDQLANGGNVRIRFRYR
jgi:hypothetical protein